MRRNKIALLLGIALCMPLLGGCSLSDQVENQGFVLVMGLDRAEDGQLELTAQIPKITGGSSGEDGNKGNANYTSLQVTGSDYGEALERLTWAVPRELNLSQTKLIAVSRELASEAAFPQLIRFLAETERLFTSTWLAVCDGNAGKFIQALQPIIGTRLSTDINATFEHYVKRGYIPTSRLAELYYQTNSVYSDPMAAYALLDERASEDQKADESKPAAALAGSPDTLSEDYKSEIAARYLGAALFSEGQLCGVLSGADTMLVNLLRGELDSFRYESDGRSIELVPTFPIGLSVELSDAYLRLKVRGRLSVSVQQHPVDAKSIEQALEKELTQLIRSTQEMGCDPFGFAEKAAWKFLKMDDWIEYNWKERYRQAEIDVDLKIVHTGT